MPVLCPCGHGPHGSAQRVANAPLLLVRGRRTDLLRRAGDLSHGLTSWGGVRREIRAPGFAR